MKSTNAFYERQALLLKDKQNNLENKEIIIIGAGGLGSSIAYALASSGIKSISIVDFDIVSLSNIQRQIMFNFSDEGRAKVDCFTKLKERSFCDIKTYKMSAAEFFATNPKADLIMDATDNLSVRSEIDNFAKANNIPWIFASVEEFFVSASIVKNKKIAFNKEIKRIKPQATPFVMFSASYASILALKYLAGFDIKVDYLYYFDFSKDILNLSKFNL
ncbi:ThiF family protein [Campylobacter sp. RM5004]|uniref:HesA/MoeB/ThiF family protein n=1 Tax=Campylobacter sp. RM5004 TaxID=1660078 RepID=UPI001EFC1735|nr:ThiF family adenylyltransferase [Campylobacter sp. RM5004]ULO02232.1 ThiF family protein [Campylobacter sp. RM5004]